ncbi:Multidrug resistance protein MdtC [Fundidesulfovibrio magnetotacticus]|uniref:Multidrug resistance protein MdtC n=1 Tax=Fundidesulfovibrio magnetotacticus TaxID=2730080 RepID=A0A6V8LKR6_9BACT|nr:efflux RND transporter permease subunit [Fundidesulfovibrio magnetotacticus]GFK92274.1 Multidrug resistance protein MdtC [Fundidesulfovibrio magnetotacticus]
MTRLFITRPVATALVTLGLVFLGLTAYFALPVSEMPAIDFPTIQVSANLPGADPETMASSVATPLEKQFATIAGVTSMNSVNTLGQTTIVLQFELGRNMDGAGSDVQTAISAASGYLPPNLPNPPTYQKVNPADAPVLFIGMRSATLPLHKLTDYAKTYVSQRISMVSGVAQVAIYGDQTYSPRLRLDPDKLAAYNLSISQVADAIQAENVNLPTGSLYGQARLFTIKVKGMLMNARHYIDQIVAWRAGKPIRLGDVGTAVDSTLNDKNASYHNQSPSLTIAVRRQPGTNTIKLVESIRDQLPAIQATLPQSIEFEVMYDRSQTIKESVEDVKFTMALSVSLVVLVVFAFLKNVRATLIACLALPVAVVGTFAVMKQFGFSLDNLSLMALTLAIGFIVDDAIVMLENIVRHMEMGKKPMEAALDGAGQIGFTIVSMTLSLAVVFVPIMFMAGILGRVLNELAVTITIAIFVSGFVTLSFTPMLCSRFLREGRVGHSGRIFKALEAAYEKSLRLALEHRFAVLLASFAVLGLTLWLFTRVPTGFIPTTDTGFIYGYAQAEQSASFETMKERVLNVTKIVAENPNVHKVVGIVGVGGPNTSMNNAAFFTLTKPASQRKDDIDAVLGQLRGALSQVTNLRLFMFNPPAIQIGGRSTRALYQFTLLSPDTQSLYAAARRMEELMRGLPELRDVNSDMQIDGPQVFMRIDRDKAASYGVSAKAIETALWSAYGARQISNIYASTDTYRVVIEVEPEYQRSPDLLSKLYVQPDLENNKDKNKDKLVPLAGLVAMDEGVGPITVNHTGQLTSVTISFNTAPGYSLSHAVAAIETLADRELPGAVSRTFEGQATAFKESASSVPFLMLLAVVVIYIILGVLYESFVHPVTILSGLPSAALGGLLALLAFGRELDLYGFVGVIMLMGIVKKNAIMVIDFAIEAEKTGKTSREAAFQGCVTRFRPIMMTTVAAVAGIMPIAMAYGAGGDARQPLGLAVAGGLAISQVVTLYLTPVAYTYLDDLQGWFKRRMGGSFGG